MIDPDKVDDAQEAQSVPFKTQPKQQSRTVVQVWGQKLVPCDTSVSRLLLSPVAQMRAGCGHLARTLTVSSQCRVVGGAPCISI